MRRVRLDIQYDGTNYAGWQRQDNALSVQEVLERELHVVTGEHTGITGAGRTDSGVHALGQVAHFDTCVRMDAAKFAYALNAGLPRDIRVHRSMEVDADFHARFGARSKHYRYAIRQSAHASALTYRYELHRHTPLLLEPMLDAAAQLVGTHDFAAFMAAGSAVKDTVRTVYASRWSQEGEMLYYDVVGNGFLYHMVRILVGTMLEIGQGKRASLPLGSSERKDAGPTAPAQGLTLVRVNYDMDINV